MAHKTCKWMSSYRAHFPLVKWDVNATRNIAILNVYV